MTTALTFAIMDAPYENSRTVTVFRLIQAALRAGHDVNVFAYEGAVALAFARQAAHPNAVHGRDAAQENHPLPRVWIAELLRLAERNGRKLDWVNCGLCVDERGVGEAIEGVRRGSPADFWKMSVESGNTLVVATC
ncbi:MAG: DsrE family protein [Steroidobacteraceae bacterium]